MSLPATNPNPLVRPVEAATVFWSLVSVAGVVLGIVGLALDKGGTWLAPLAGGFIAAISLAVQGANQRENQKELARISDELKKNSMLYERRLDAFAEVTRAMLDAIEHAEATIRAVNAVRDDADAHFQPPSKRFFEGAQDSLERFHAHRPILYLLADEETRQVLDTFAATINTLDTEHMEIQVEARRFSDEYQVQVHYDGDLGPINKALEGFRRDYQALLKHARTYLQQ